MKNKQKLLPFNLEEALKNPERVVFIGSSVKIKEVIFPITYTNRIIILDVLGNIYIFNSLGYILDIKDKNYNLALLPIPDKITKTYQVLQHMDDRILIANCPTLKLANTYKGKESYIAIQETTYNHTTGEISIKIVHKY